MKRKLILEEINMNGYLIILDHWSGERLVEAIMAPTANKAKEIALRNHGEKSQIMEVHEMNDRGLTVYYRNKINVI